VTRGEPRRAALLTRLRERERDEQGVTTLVEVLIASTLLLVVCTLVAVTMSMVSSIQVSVQNQYQEFDQALPALGPIQALLRAQVEPAASVSNVPTPPFSVYGTPPASLSFAVQFYSNVGTAFNNVTGAGTTAGPAKIVAMEVDQSGNPVTSSSTCSPQVPCSFQVRRYLPIVNSGTSTCPVAPDGSAGPCQYPPAKYTLVVNALHVVNNPNPNLPTTPLAPIFTYGLFDPDWNVPGTGILVSSSEIQNNQLTGLAAAPYSYPSNTQNLTACAAPVNGTYPTRAIACPLDAVQSVSIDLQVATTANGSLTGTKSGSVENQTVVYRYPPTGSGSTISYPYQFTTAVG
jgi:hypothetical protein